MNQLTTNNDAIFEDVCTQSLQASLDMLIQDTESNPTLLAEPGDPPGVNALASINLTAGVGANVPTSSFVIEV